MPRTSPQDRSMILESVKQDGLALQRASDDLKQDKEVVFEAVKQNGLALRYASDDLKQDNEVVLEAVKQYGHAFQYASADLKRDKEVVLEAVKQNGLALLYASADLKQDKEVVLEAVKQNGIALRYASDDLKQDKYASADLKQDKEVVLEAVKQNGLALLYASADLKQGKEVVLEAVKQNGIVLRHACDDLKWDKEVVLEAVKQNGVALQYASADLKQDKKFILEAVKQNGFALKYASDDLKHDKEVVLEAVKQNGEALKYASADLKKGKEVVLEAVKQNGKALLCASDDLNQDKKFVLEAVKQNGGALTYASDDFKQDKKFIFEAVKQNGSALKYASDDLKQDKKFISEAVKQNGSALKYASADLKQDKEVVLEAVKQNWCAIEFAPSEVRELLQTAVKTERLKQALDRGVLEAVKDAIADVPGGLEAVDGRGRSYRAIIAEHDSVSDEILLLAGVAVLRGADGFALGDAGVEAAMTQLQLMGVAEQIVWLDLSHNDLSVIPEAVGELTKLETLKLGGNHLTELPLVLTQLTKLKALDVSEMPVLGPVAEIYAKRGVGGVFDYLRDFHDDPQPCWSLKLLLAGPSMAGKSSLLNALRFGESKLTDEKDGRTVGLDIERLDLRDPRAPSGIQFLCYDAGGHDEYQEMHQIFLSQSTLYLLVWNVALAARGASKSADAVCEKLVGWANLIQTCSPGATVLLVASHADEVEDSAVLKDRCETVVRVVGDMLLTHREAQRRECEHLKANCATASAQERLQKLERILKFPLQLAKTAVAVSAKTLAGIDELRRHIVAAVLDSSAFPTFGKKQPRTYTNMMRILQGVHRDDSSVTWGQMQATLERQPRETDPLRIRFTGSELHAGAQSQVQQLHGAIDKARDARWAELASALFPEDSRGCVLPLPLLNSVPPPRTFGVLHQLAYHGAVDAYKELVRRGAVFDASLLSSDGRTAEQVAEAAGQHTAQGSDHRAFAATMREVGRSQSALNASVSAAADVSIIGDLKYKAGKRSFLDVRAELSDDGKLTLTGDGIDAYEIDLTSDGAKVREPTHSEPKRPFCLEIELITPTKRTVRLDAVQAPEYQRWLKAIGRFATLDTKSHWKFFFSVELCHQVVQQFSIRFDHAKSIHDELSKAGQCRSLRFPAHKATHWLKNMTSDAVNVARRGRKLAAYYEELLNNDGVSNAPLFETRMGFSRETLMASRRKLSLKVSEDKQLLRRAMLFLQSMGEVLYHDLEHGSTDDRPIEAYSWYWGEKSREEVEPCLTKAGDFLVHKSATQRVADESNFVLSVCDSAGPSAKYSHFSLAEDAGRFRFGSGSYSSVGALVRHYVASQDVLSAESQSRLQAAVHRPGSLQDRVFLEPKRLVDIMKALMHHDLKEQVQSIAHDTCPDPDRIKGLGMEFLQRGVLDEELLPWLWRDVRPRVSDNSAQISFLVGLLCEAGLLTRVPGPRKLWLLPMRLPDRTEALVTAAARRRNAAVVEQMEIAVGAPAKDVTLEAAVAAMTAVLPKEALEEGRRTAGLKADAVLGDKEVDESNLCHDEIGAINLYTQENMYTDQCETVNVYRPMNTALRCGERADIEPYWLYIKLLQRALLKLKQAPRDTKLYRGIKKPVPDVTLDELLQRQRDREPEVWVAFTSTTSQEEIARGFLRGTNDKRILYSLKGGTARDVKRYSAIAGEEELVIPCGSAFVVLSAVADPKDPNLLEVQLKQTDAALLEGPHDAVDVHQHGKLAAAYETLGAPGTKVDFVKRQYEFHQPLPPGFLAVVISRCARQCSDVTSIWRRDIVTLMKPGRQHGAELLAMSRRELVSHAKDVGVPQQAIDDVLLGDERATVEEVKQRIIELILAHLQLEVSLGQTGISSVAITARCLAGNHHVECLRNLKIFEGVMRSVIDEQWPGCSLTIVCLPQRTAIADGILLADAEQALHQGHDSVTVGDSMIRLSELGLRKSDADDGLKSVARDRRMKRVEQMPASSHPGSSC